MSGSKGERTTPQGDVAKASADADEPLAASSETAPDSGTRPSEEGTAAAATEPGAATAASEPPAEPATEVAAGDGTTETAAGAASAPPAAPEPPAAPAAAPAGEATAPQPEGADAGDPGAHQAAERPALRRVREALEQRQPVEGRVIGWNNGGFHLALGELSAFCPRSEMEIGEAAAPESYLDKTFSFRVLRLQGKGRRIVVSRAAQLRAESSRQRAELRKRIRPGAVLDGTVSSLTDFGAFVDLGGTQGLVHVSEISHRRLEHPSAALAEGQQVQVKVIKVEKGGRRISLSMRALEPDPWKELAGRFERGAIVRGKVEKATSVGAFIELAPGLTGLLPVRSMAIPREANPARAYPPGKEVSVQILSIDPRRQRISLALEGSALEGSRSDFQEYQRQRRKEGDGQGFNALASAFRRLRDDAD